MCRGHDEMQIPVSFYYMYFKRSWVNKRNGTLVNCPYLTRKIHKTPYLTSLFAAAYNNVHSSALRLLPASYEQELIDFQYHGQLHAVYPLTYSIAESYIAPLFSVHRSIPIMCTLRGHAKVFLACLVCVYHYVRCILD